MLHYLDLKFALPSTKDKEAKMNDVALIEKKHELEEKYDDEHRYVVAGVKRALAEDRLVGIKKAADHLHAHPAKAPGLVTYLNNLLGHRALLFRWLPGNNNNSSRLLIRNESVGVLVKTAPDSSSMGMKLTPHEDTPFVALEPESAFSLLSRQARNQL